MYKIIVENGGILEFGDQFKISAETQIACRKNVKFGHGCLLSWDILIMDSDFHKIKDNEGKIINQD